MDPQPIESTPTLLVFSGQDIRLDGEMVNLTDMWRAAGAPEHKRPNDWAKHPEGARFISFIRENLNAGKNGNECFRAVRGGNDPATWAHWQIGIAYAQSLSVEFHAWCNTVVRAHMQGRTALAADPQLGQAMRALLATAADLQARLGAMEDAMALVRRAADNPERFASPAMLKDDPEAADRICLLMHRAAEAQSPRGQPPCSWHRVHGAIRRKWQVTSYLRLSWRVHSAVTQWLHELVLRDRTLPPPRHPKVVLIDPRQSAFSFVRAATRRGRKPAGELPS